MVDLSAQHPLVIALGFESLLYLSLILDVVAHRVAVLHFSFGLHEGLCRLVSLKRLVFIAYSLNLSVKPSRIRFLL